MRKTRLISTSLFALALSLPLPALAQAPAAETPAPVPAPAAEPAPAAAAPPPAATAAAPAPAAAKLAGLAAWNAIVGNTINGKRDGVEFNYVKADGTIVWLDDGDIETGKWALEGQNVCVTFPDEDKECLSVELDGDVITFKDETGSGFRGTLLKGNPKKL